MWDGGSSLRHFNGYSLEGLRVFCSYTTIRLRTLCSPTESLQLLSQNSTKWHKGEGWALEATGSKSQDREAWWEHAGRQRSSILSLPVKVKSQGECQPMHRQLNGGALLWSLSDCKQAIIKSLWWQSTVLKGTNKNKYIKHNKSQGPVVETHYP